METKDFLQTVLAARGNYCILAVKDGRKVQKFYNHIDKLLHSAHEFDGNGYDTYFALATFDDEGSRKAAHAVDMRALFVDLDCGPSKDYPDQPTALQALRAFCMASSMPRPITVSSGYGVHAYWPLRDAVPVGEWLHVAKRLKRAFAKHGLATDTVVTADAARVLRIPGTHNWKNGEQKPVHIIGSAPKERLSLAHYADILGAAAPSTTAPAAVPLAHGLSIEDDPVMQRLLNSRSASFRRIVEKTVQGHGCAQIGWALTNQASVSEPLWRATLSIAKHCSDGKKAAHRLSQGHPHYDPEETDRKLAGIKGPYTCARFMEIRPDGCEGCPLRDKVKSPIVIGHEIDPAETVEIVGDAGEPQAVYRTSQGEIPTYPWPYMRPANGGIFIRQTTDDGTDEDMLIYSNDLYYTKRIVDPEHGECVVGRLQLPRDAMREFVVPLIAATSKEELRKALSRQGVAVGAKKWDHIMAYTQAWVDRLQLDSKADTARTQFGWTDNDFTSYVIGEREIFADSIAYNPPSSKTAFLFPALRKRGTLDGWKAQAEFYNRPGLEPYQYIVCQALAAPLMRFTPVNAAIFDFYSDGSGHGKSTTQKFALTIYGEPGPLIVGPTDTLNARMNRMELMKDVNLQFDEFTEFPAEHTSDLIYGITDGRQKARMASGSNDERFRGQPWHTTVTASSNQSMLAKVYSRKANPEAEVQRVLRYHVQPHNFTDKAETDAFAKQVGQHYGHAIEVFIQKILQDVDMVRSLIDKVQRTIDVACGLTMKNRFWSVQGAVTLSALILAREAGLLDYDPRRMMRWIVALIRDNKMAAHDTRITSDAIINDFVQEHYGEILLIKSTDTLRGNNNNALDSLVVPEMQPRGRLVARYETDVKMLYISISPLKRWCIRQKLNYDSVTDELIQKYKGKKTRMRICRGTRLNLPPAYVLALDCSDLDLDLAEGVNGDTEN